MRGTDPSPFTGYQIRNDYATIPSVTQFDVEMPFDKRLSFNAVNSEGVKVVDVIKAMVNKSVFDPYTRLMDSDAL